MRKNRLLPSECGFVERCATTLPGIPLVEVCNNRRVLIENHQGIVGYESDEIIIKVRSGNICVCGDRLQLNRMSRYQLVITGVITAVHFMEQFE